jgi:hypothetical protein
MGVLSEVLELFGFFRLALPFLFELLLLDRVEEDDFIFLKCSELVCEAVPFFPLFLFRSLCQVCHQ